MKMSVLTRTILESNSLSLIVLVITDQGFLNKVNLNVQSNAKHQIETLKYLRKHFESNPKLVNPMVQLAAQHRVLIEEVLNIMFVEDKESDVSLGLRYRALIELLQQVDALRSAKAEECAAAAAE